MPRPCSPDQLVSLAGSASTTGGCAGWAIRAFDGVDMAGSSNDQPNIAVRIPSIQQIITVRSIDFTDQSREPPPSFARALSLEIGLGIAHSSGVNGAPWPHDEDKSITRCRPAVGRYHGARRDHRSGATVD